MFLLPLLAVSLTPAPADPVGVWDTHTLLTATVLGEPRDRWIPDGTIVIERLHKSNRCYAVSWYRSGQVQHITTIIAAGDGSYQGKLPTLPGHSLKHFEWELTWDFLNRAFVFRLGSSGVYQPWRMRQIGKIPE